MRRNQDNAEYLVLNTFLVVKILGWLLKCSGLLSLKDATTTGWSLWINLDNFWVGLKWVSEESRPLNPLEKSNLLREKSTFKINQHMHSAKETLTHLNFGKSHQNIKKLNLYVILSEYSTLVLIFSVRINLLLERVGVKITGDASLVVVSHCC